MHSEDDCPSCGKYHDCMWCQFVDADEGIDFVDADEGTLEAQLRASLDEPPPSKAYSKWSEIKTKMPPERREQISNEIASEVRVTDPKTGGQKGQKLAQLGAIDPAALLELAKVAGFGAGKYERLNFVRGYRWSLSYDALQRHLHAFWNGEEIDGESGLPHLAHAGWHVLALLTFSLRKRGTDDRIGTVL